MVKEAFSIVKFTNNNNTLLKKRSQELLGLGATKLEDVKPNDEFFKDPIDFIKKLTTGERVVLDILAEFSNKYRYIWASQSTFAKLTGYTREHINKTIRKLQEKNLIYKHYRYDKTCLYKVSSVFDNIEIRAKLKKLLASLVFFPLFTLFSQDFTLSNNSIYNTNSILYNEGKNFLKNLSLKNMELTRSGKIRLSMFPDTIINQADEMIIHGRNLNDRFKVFWSYCKKLCLQEGIKLNWDRFNSFAKLFFVKREDPSLKGKANLFPNPDSFFVVEEENPKKGRACLHPDDEAQPKFDVRIKKPFYHDSYKPKEKFKTSTQEIEKFKAWHDEKIKNEIDPDFYEILMECSAKFGDIHQNYLSQ